MDEIKSTRPLAVVTVTLSGIAYYLARIAADHGYNLALAPEPSLAHVAAECTGTVPKDRPS